MEKETLHRVQRSNPVVLETLCDTMGLFFIVVRLSFRYIKIENFQDKDYGDWSICVLSRILTLYWLTLLTWKNFEANLL